VEAANGPEVEELTSADTSFDLFLLDLYMPGVNGLALVRSICDRFPEVPVVVLSATESVGDMQQVIDYGASGFIPKCAGRGVLLNALRLVLAGGTYIPPEMLAQHPADMHPQARAVSPRETGTFGVKCIEGITPRQQDVLQLVISGMTNKEIARALGLAENTVKVHIAAILRVLNVRNRTQAVAALRKLGI
jgi:DNA-binding NarL/FixJ family response regulator